MIKKNDNITIISGKDRGKSGQVLKIFPKQDRILVEGVNMRKKHIRPKKAGEKGQTVQMPMPIHISNAMVVCKNCSKRTRIGKKILGNGVKIRVCKKCGSEI